MEKSREIARAINDCLSGQDYLRQSKNRPCDWKDVGLAVAENGGCLVRAEVLLWWAKEIHLAWGEIL